MPRMKRMAARARSNVRHAPRSGGFEVPQLLGEGLELGEDRHGIHETFRGQVDPLREDGFFFCGMIVDVPQYWSARSIMPNS